MPYTPLHISIPEPCSVPWDGMTPVTDQSRHCGSCDKVITDFSAMTDAQIGRALSANGGKLCGRFRRNQLGRTLRLDGPRRRRGLGPVAAAASLLLAAPVYGQQAEPVLTEASVKVNAVSAAQPTGPMRLITGKVTDEDGEALIGASILIQGTTCGTVTDLDGQFSLNVNNAKSAILEVHYTGFITQQYAVDDLRKDANLVLPVGAAICFTAGIVVTTYATPDDPIDRILVHPVNRIRPDRPLGPAKTGDWKDYWRDLFAARKARRVKKKAAKQALRADRLARLPEVADAPPAKSNTPATDPVSFRLTASPNPFGQELTVGFDLPEAQPVYLTLFTASGRTITAWKWEGQAGSQTMRLGEVPAKLRSGTYFLRIVAGERSETVTVVRQ